MLMLLVYSLLKEKEGTADLCVHVFPCSLLALNFSHFISSPSSTHLPFLLKDGRKAKRDFVSDVFIMRREAHGISDEIH
jgi:hypothetical protein